MKSFYNSTFSVDMIKQFPTSNVCTGVCVNIYKYIKTGLLPLLFKDFVQIAVYLLVSILSFRNCVYINLLPASQSKLGYGTMRLLI